MPSRASRSCYSSKRQIHLLDRPNRSVAAERLHLPLIASAKTLDLKVGNAQDAKQLAARVVIGQVAIIPLSHDSEARPHQVGSSWLYLLADLVREVIERSSEVLQARLGTADRIDSLADVGLSEHG